MKNCHGIIAHEHFTDTETNGGCLKEQFAVLKKESSAVLLESGLAEKWLAGSMECYCYLSTKHARSLVGW